MTDLGVPAGSWIAYLGLRVAGGSIRDDAIVIGAAVGSIVLCRALGLQADFWCAAGAGLMRSV